MTPRFERVREFGLWRGLYASVMSALKRAIGLNLFLVELGDDRSELAMPDLEPGYTTRTVTPDELLPWADKPGYGLSRQFLEQASRQGARAVANFHHSELVGYGFVARHRAPVTPQIDVAVDRRLVYRFKGWTHPDHRRKHLSHARGRLNKSLFPLAADQRTVSYVETHNYASKLHRSDVHPEPVGHCGFVRLFGREVPFTLPGARRVGFRLVRSVR